MIKKINLNQIWNNDKCQCECKNPIKSVCKNGSIWHPARGACENGKYLGSIIDNSIVCDEFIETTKSVLTKTVPTKSFLTNFSEKKSNL